MSKCGSQAHGVMAFGKEDPELLDRQSTSPFGSPIMAAARFLNTWNISLRNKQKMRDKIFVDPCANSLQFFGTSFNLINTDSALNNISFADTL